MATGVYLEIPGVVVWCRSQRCQEANKVLFGIKMVNIIAYPYY